jgi:hypothetical protein
VADIVTSSVASWKKAYKARLDYSAAQGLMGMEHSQRRIKQPTLIIRSTRQGEQMKVSVF